MRLWSLIGQLRFMNVFSEEAKRDANWPNLKTVDSTSYSLVGPLKNGVGRMGAIEMLYFNS